MIDRTSFEELVKETIANLFDFAALETRPDILAVFKPPADSTIRPGAYVREYFSQAIEQLKPPRREISLNAPEWRPYLILHKRYIEGLPLKDLAAELAIGDRQMRRDHHRAMQILTLYVWNQLFPEKAVTEGLTAESPVAPDDEEEKDQSFEIHKQEIDLYEVLSGVLQILTPRLAAQGLSVEINFPDHPARILIDRIILRQIFINILNTLIRLNLQGQVRFSIHRSGPQIILKIDLPAHTPISKTKEETEEMLEPVRYWCEQVGAKFHFLGSQTPPYTFTFSFPQVGQAVILVIDDQLPVINLFRRYLSQTTYSLVGATSVEQALPLANQLQPALITLDVMMPQLDGWEALQMLKLNPATQHIPVLVCSAWEEPELALSLGATGFLKKPITQKAFLDELSRLGY